VTIVNFNIKKVSEEEEIIAFAYTEICTGNVVTPGIIHMNKANNAIYIVEPCSTNYHYPSMINGKAGKEFLIGESVLAQIAGRYRRKEPMDDFDIHIKVRI